MYRAGYFIPGDSFLHRRDPRVKILAGAVISLVILRSGVPQLLAWTALLLITASLARLPWPALAANLRPVLPFFALLFLVYALFTPGLPLVNIPHVPLQITYSGLYTGMQQVGRFLLLVLAAALMIMTTSPADLNLGIERLLRPLGVLGISSHELALMLSLALRFLPSLVQETETIRMAQAARGAGLNPPGWRRRIGRINQLVMPLAASLVRRSDELVLAMEARGYRPGPRTYLRELTWGPADFGMLLGVVLVAVLSSWIKF